MALMGGWRPCTQLCRYDSPILVKLEAMLNRGEPVNLQAAAAVIGCTSGGIRYWIDAMLLAGKVRCVRPGVYQSIARSVTA